MYAYAVAVWYLLLNLVDPFFWYEGRIRTDELIWAIFLGLGIFFILNGHLIHINIQKLRNLFVSILSQSLLVVFLKCM